MQKFSQKWTLISFFQPVEVGMEFNWKEWPLHVTIMNTFAVDTKQPVWELVSAKLQQFTPLELTATHEVVWGNNHVMLLELTPDLQRLHTSIHSLLQNNGAVFNEPQYVGVGYLPHSTNQSRARLQPNDKVAVNSVAVIDMFPDGDPYARRVVRIITIPQQPN